MLENRLKIILMVEMEINVGALKIQLCRNLNDFKIR